MGKAIKITNETRTRVPRAVFNRIKQDVLGPDYELSLVIAPPDEMKKLNLIYRDKNKPTDILSFPINKKEGEMFICPSEAKKESAKFGRDHENFLLFLFIHGCVHLKGLDHGGRMERTEVEIRKRFNV